MPVASSVIACYVTPYTPRSLLVFLQTRRGRNSNLGGSPRHFSLRMREVSARISDTVDTKLPTDAGIICASVDDSPKLRVRGPPRQVYLRLFVGLRRRPARRAAVLEEGRLSRCPRQLEQVFEHPHRAVAFPLARGR